MTNTMGQSPSHDVELKALLERVEAATGPDRELDCDIAVCLGLWAPPEGGTRLAADKWRRRDINYYQPHEPYSASVDAALALVERALPDTVRPGFQQNPDKTWGAAILRVDPDEGECPYATAATAPLAILAALLRSLVDASGAAGLPHSADEVGA